MLRISMAACAGLVAATAHAAPQPVELKPTGPWKIEYADDACILNRPFAAAGQAYQLQLTFEPIKSDVWLRVHNQERIRSRDHGETVVEVDGVRVRDDVHFNIFGNSRGGTTREFWLTDFRKVRAMRHSLRLVPGRHGDLKLATDDFQAAMRSIDTCADDLHRSLGIDPTMVKSIATPPAGFSGRFVDLPDFSDQFDYQILYWVTASGKVDECRLLAPTGNRTFDKNACEQLKKRGSFKPARNAAGEAIRAPVYENPTIRRTVIRY